MVTKNEYRDLGKMLEVTDLHEKDSSGEYYTWTNNQANVVIYSRIDHVLGNLSWLQQHIDFKLQILNSGVSDHSLMCLCRQEDKHPSRTPLKFKNVVTNVLDFQEVVRENWNNPMFGATAMCILWKKLKCLQLVIKSLSRTFIGISRELSKAREQLTTVQKDLLTDQFNMQIIKNVKSCTMQVLNLSNLEEQLLRQKSKVDWLKLGDGNNTYFHASLKSKTRKTQIISLFTENGDMSFKQEKIAEEIIMFYRNLVGTKSSQSDSINLVAMRQGKQLTSDQRESLLMPITEEEIVNNIKGISDLYAPGIDGYNAKNFKATWSITKVDVIAVVKEFFEEGLIYKAVNYSVITLIPKSDNTNMVKDFRLISCCTVIYKIISRIMSTRLGKVLSVVLHQSQAAFILGHHIHDHILLAYDLINGYNTKGGTPRCMLQMDLHKAYDTMEWSTLKAILNELSFPHMFIKWTMITVTTVSYRYHMNGELSNLVLAKRGIRQGDPPFPLDFCDCYGVSLLCFTEAKSGSEFQFSSEIRNIFYHKPQLCRRSASVYKRGSYVCEIADECF